MSRAVTRLYKQFKPEHYDISIAISDDKESFTGSITLKGTRVGRPSQRITLHQKGLTISNPTIKKHDKKDGDQAINVIRSVSQNKLNEIRLHVEDDLYPGEYTVSMDFSGKITKNMDGIYPCFFTHDGQDKRLIATQFESHHAREAFPCIDEPEAKATFKLELTHTANETALGNTPIVDEKVTKDRKTTTFDTTPIMSTYLLAFVVGDIRYKEASSKSGVTIRTYATPDQVEHTEFALDVAVQCMDFYEDYFDIPFPLPKCDFIALPDFASGAMENWGLITFREQALLMDAQRTSLSTKQWVAMVVAHELAHQWFGNLVTMRWWTDLWLNEGFASWIEYLALVELYPEWDMWTQFAVDEQQAALKADGLEHTHPVEVPVKHPDEIRTIFDMISYQKGSSVIHMLHSYLGPEGFRDGLRHYLKKHSYKNTDTVDLWQALQDVTKKPVTEFMGQWTSQSGYPLLEVSVVNDHLKITQSRFVSNPKSPARADKALWPAPLHADGLAHDIAHKRTTNVLFTTDAKPHKLNIGQTAFYRVDYSADMQQEQIKSIREGDMDAIDRMGLLADGFEVTKAGYQSVTEYLALLSEYGQEDSLPAWEIIAGSIGSIRSTLSKSSDEEALRNEMKPFIRGLVRTQLDRLGWDKNDNENHLDTLLRPVIISLAAGADEDSILSKCQEAYTQWLGADGEINPDLRGIILSTTARRGGQKEFDELLQKYKASTSSDEKLSITGAITSFEQPDIHKQVLELITSGTVRLQDISYWMAYSFMNRHSRDATWQWLKDNWQWLKDSIGTDLSFSRTPLYAARNFVGQDYISEFSSFFNEHMEPMLDRSFKQSIEILETNTAWNDRDSDAALKWFKNRNALS